MTSLGWKKDKRDERDYSTSVLFGQKLRTTIQSEASVLRFRRGRLLQGHAGSCVAQAITRASHICQLARGNDAAPMPSAMFTYWAGRKQENAGLDPASAPPLDDTGMYPRLAMKAVRNVGMLRADQCPYDDAKVNHELKANLLRLAYDQRDFGYYRAFGSRVSAAKDALRRGLGMIFGIQVDEPFTKVSSDAPIHAIDGTRLLGGHMLTVLEVRSDGCIVFDNWWDDWGYDDGLGVLAPELFESAWVDDVYVIQSAPLLEVAA
jgi:hypothetical protein